MNNKIILPISLMLLVGLAVFVSASTVESYYNFQQGWNLVYGFTNPDKLNGGDIIPDNIKAIYILKQPTQEYIRIYPNPETKKLEGIQDSYYEKTAQWVYSDKAGRSKYLFEEPLPPQYWREYQIYKGWNLIGITSYLAGKLQGEIKGDCNFEKIYFWDSADQKWADWSVNEKDDIENDWLGYGLVVKVSNNCNLGISGSITPPPTIPN